MSEPYSSLVKVTNPAHTPRLSVHLQVVSDGRADGRASVSDSPPAPGAKSKGKKGKGKKAEGGKVRPLATRCDAVVARHANLLLLCARVWL